MTQHYINTAATFFEFYPLLGTSFFKPNSSFFTFRTLIVRIASSFYVVTQFIFTNCVPPILRFTILLFFTKWQCAMAFFTKISILAFIMAFTFWLTDFVQTLIFIHAVIFVFTSLKTFVIDTITFFATITIFLT